MYKLYPIYIVLTIIAAGIALVAFSRSKEKTQELNIVADSRFYGKKLATNYYEFSILDYHRLIIQRKAHILFFCLNEVLGCVEQDRILRDTMDALQTNSVVVLYNRDKEFHRTFRVGPLTFIPFEADGHQRPVVTGLQNTLTLQVLLSKL